jgi:hypothetical protein
MAISGNKPSEEDLEWLKYGRDLVKESPKILDEAAKSFLTLGSSLLTVYMGALALLKPSETVYGPFFWAIICTPIVLWLFCIGSITFVYFPDRWNIQTNCPSNIEKVTQDISRKKSCMFKIGSILFVAALTATSISVVLFVVNKL